jgi:hypothetical protein
MEGSYSTVWKPSTLTQDALPRKMLETTIGFLCLYFHPNGKWLLTCEVCILNPEP